MDSGTVSGMHMDFDKESYTELSKVCGMESGKDFDSSCME